MNQVEVPCSPANTTASAVIKDTIAMGAMLSKMIYR